MRGTILLLSLVPMVTGCSLFGLDGCTDTNALNYDVPADNNDGSCEFSRVVFYQLEDGPPATVTVDGTEIGTVTAFHPTGPNNCATPGTAQYQITDPRSHTWAAQAGARVGGGEVPAERSTTCLQIPIF